MEFKKGDYVVLLSSCNGTDHWAPEIPINYVYCLSRDGDSHNFGVVQNLTAESDGWSADSNYNSKLKLRYATEEEIKRYLIEGKPVKTMEQQIIGYKLLKDLPDIEAGNIFKKSNEEFKCDGGKTYYWKVTKNGIVEATKYTTEFITDKPDWFEPVYAKPELKIQGHKVIVKGNTITVGCTTINALVLIDFDKTVSSLFMKGNVIKSFTLSDGTTITLDEVKEIVKFYLQETK